MANKMQYLSEQEYLMTSDKNAFAAIHVLGRPYKEFTWVYLPIEEDET